MKKNYYKYLVAFVLCLSFFLPSEMFGLTASAYSGYTITDYDIDMVVNENNTFDITEAITVDFDTAKHGIFRKIPLRNSVIRADGTSSGNRARITNINVSEEFSVSIEDGYQVIKIGSSGLTVTGEHSYTISYTYDIGKDPLEDADELYFNLIGDEWDTSIDYVTFRITMPKEFDESLLGFSSGNKGTFGSNDIIYTVNGNEISGYLMSELHSGQALTVRLTLPEGYFVGASENVNIYALAAMLLSVLCVFLAAAVWFIFGRNGKASYDTVEFYPPNGCNSAEAGYYYYGYANNKSVMSLLVYLAGKGYIKIQEFMRGNPTSPVKDVRIIKLREYYENNECERLFFRGLFKSSVDGSVKVGELRNNFYTTVQEVSSKLNSSENEKLIFKASSLNKRPFLKFLAFIVYLAIAAAVLWENKLTVGFDYEGSVMSIASLCFSGMGLIVCSTLIGKKSKSSFLSVLIYCCVLFFPSVAMAMYYLRLEQNKLCAMLYIVGAISIGIIFAFMSKMKKRTPFGKEMLVKLKGFRRFLETAEKPQIEMLVQQNPEYFYDVLPYAYALGVSDKWIKQFEALAMQPPAWYDSYDPYDPYIFVSFMNSTMSSVESVMYSSTSSSYSGSGGYSDGGGGCSGGGSGGGGGGSW